MSKQTRPTLRAATEGALFHVALTVVGLVALRAFAHWAERSKHRHPA